MAPASFFGKTGVGFDTKSGGRDTQRRKRKEKYGKLNKNIREDERHFEFLLIVEDEL